VLTGRRGAKEDLCAVLAVSRSNPEHTPALGSLVEVRVAKNSVCGTSRAVSTSEFNERVRKLPEHVVGPKKLKDRKQRG